MSVVANPLVVRIFINSTLTGRENGWAERWPIWETNWNTALGYALLMVQARQRVLSSNAYIQWACLGSVVAPYYEQTVVTDALYPLPQWGPAASDMQGILFDLSTETGENAPRLLRAIEATEIAAKRWVYADMPIPSAPPPLPANLATAPKDLLWQNALATFRQYAATQQPMSDGHHGPGDGYWVDPFSQAVYRQVGSRRWGRPWKRMSWEAAPFVNAPQFSPCGCVVTVNRISYAIPCRFGPGWSRRWIHYYDAAPGATVMTFKTPFCCWNRSLEYTDFSGVGEAKKFQRRNWTNGSEWGAAPGVIWTGPQQYFQGFAPEPPIPTPGFMRPACDTPVAPPNQIAPGGAGGGGVGITIAVGTVPADFVVLKRVSRRQARAELVRLQQRRFPWPGRRKAGPVVLKAAWRPEVQAPIVVRAKKTFPFPPVVPRHLLTVLKIMRHYPVVAKTPRIRQRTFSWQRLADLAAWSNLARQQAMRRIVHGKVITRKPPPLIVPPPPSVIVQSQSGTGMVGATIVMNFPVATTPGNFLVVYLNTDAGIVSGMPFGAGPVSTAAMFGAGGRVSIYAAVNQGTTSGFTLNVAGMTYFDWTIVEFNQSLLSVSSNNQDDNNSNSSPNTTADSGTATAAPSPGLALAFLGTGVGTVGAISSPTNSFVIVPNSSNMTKSMAVYKVLVATSNQDCQGAVSNSTFWGGCIATYD